MTRMIFVRHGESQANRFLGFSGRTDSKLTELGYTQAKLAGEYLKSYNIDRIFTSPLSRASETARMISEQTRVPCEVLPDLIEINFGDWEGKSFDDIISFDAEGIKRWHSDIAHCSFPNGESIKEVFLRAKAITEETARKYDGKTICFVTHGGIIKTLTPLWMKLPFDKIGDTPWAGNAGTTVLDFDGDYKVEIMNECSYLGEIATFISEKLTARD